MSQRVPDLPQPPSRLPPNLTDEERRIGEEYDWAIHNEEVLRQYGGLVVAVSGRRVWGVGKNHTLAWEAASKVAGCPPRHLFALVPIPGIPGFSEDLD